MKRIFILLVIFMLFSFGFVSGNTSDANVVKGTEGSPDSDSKANIIQGASAPKVITTYNFEWRGDEYTAVRKEQTPVFTSQIDGKTYTYLEIARGQLLPVPNGFDPSVQEYKQSGGDVYIWNKGSDVVTNYELVDGQLGKSQVLESKPVVQGNSIVNAVFDGENKVLELNSFPVSELGLGQVQTTENGDLYVQKDAIRLPVFVNGNTISVGTTIIEKDGDDFFIKEGSQYTQAILSDGTKISQVEKEDGSVDQTKLSVDGEVFDKNLVFITQASQYRTIGTNFKSYRDASLNLRSDGVTMSANPSITSSGEIVSFKENSYYLKTDGSSSTASYVSSDGASGRTVELNSDGTVTRTLLFPEEGKTLSLDTTAGQVIGQDPSRSTTKITDTLATSSSGNQVVQTTVSLRVSSEVSGTGTSSNYEVTFQNGKATDVNGQKVIQKDGIFGKSYGVEAGTVNGEQIYVMENGKVVYGNGKRVKDEDLTKAGISQSTIQSKQELLTKDLGLKEGISAAERQEMIDNVNRRTEYYQLYGAGKYADIAFQAQQTVQDVYGVSALFIGQEELDARMREVQESLEVLYLGKTVESLMCDDIRESPLVQDGGIGFVETEDGQERIAVSVQGKVQEVVTFTNGTEYLYKITYLIKNDFLEDEFGAETWSYNVRLSGTKTVNLWTMNKEVPPESRQTYTKQNAIIFYSSELYDSLCIEFNPEPTAMGTNNICNTFVMEDTAPTAFDLPVTSGGSSSSGSSAGDSKGPVLNTGEL